MVGISIPTEENIIEAIESRIMAFAEEAGIRVSEALALARDIIEIIETEGGD